MNGVKVALTCAPHYFPTPRSRLQHRGSSASFGAGQLVLIVARLVFGASQRKR